jgi:hypothetical protein
MSPKQPRSGVTTGRVGLPAGGCGSTLMDADQVPRLPTVTPLPQQAYGERPNRRAGRAWAQRLPDILPGKLPGERTPDDGDGSPSRSSCD